VVTIPFRSRGGRPRPARPRRSCLVVPGSNPRMLARAATTAADMVILDLEDAVAPEQKAAARATVVEALRTHDHRGRTVAVRVNDVTTPWLLDDVVTVLRGAGDRIDTVVVPKVQDAGQVWFAEHLLNQLDPDRRIGLELQVETATGAVNLTEIAHVTDRIETLVFGPGDWAADLGVPGLAIGAADPAFPGHQWQVIQAQIVTVARAVGADAIDGPYADYRDLDGFLESARRARLLGMDGKWCIHPSQIAPANEQFTPPADQVARAERTLAAYEEAVAVGRGAATLDGAMIDEASRKMAARLLARARTATQPGEAAAGDDGRTWS
jgi:citrate lyase subunit beta/citryl-CoA lyase